MARRWKGTKEEIILSVSGYNLHNKNRGGNVLLFIKLLIAFYSKNFRIAANIASLFFFCSAVLLVKSPNVKGPVPSRFIDFARESVQRQGNKTMVNQKHQLCVIDVTRIFKGFALHLHLGARLVASSNHT